MIRMLIGVLLLVAGGLLGWMSLNGPSAAPAVASPIAMTKILVSADPLQAGTLLKDADLKERSVPATDVAPTDLVADDDNRAEVRGAMLRRYMDAGQAIQRADILRPRDRGFLASVLSPGTRAISISVDATTGASGLISPGDLVDVILTQEFARGETTVGRRVVAETVLSRIRVIAVDQQIAQGAPTSSPLLSSSSARIASNVSLEVTPEQAGMVVVAGRLGKLTLTVRSVEGDPSTLATGAAKPLNANAPRAPTIPASVYGSDVSSALSNDAPASNAKMRVIQGDTVNDLVFQ